MVNRTEMISAVKALEEKTNYGSGLLIAEDVINGYVMIDGPMNSAQLRLVAEWLDSADTD